MIDPEPLRGRLLESSRQRSVCEPAAAEGTLDELLHSRLILVGREGEREL